MKARVLVTLEDGRQYKANIKCKGCNDANNKAQAIAARLLPGATRASWDIYYREIWDIYCGEFARVSRGHVSGAVYQVCENAHITKRLK